MALSNAPTGQAPGHGRVGGFTCGGTAGFTSWNSFGASCGTGLFNPGATHLPGGAAPSGDNVAYHNGTAGYWQALAATYQPGQTDITFGLRVGQRLDETFGGYTLELRAGSGTGALLASVSNAVSPVAGAFLPSSTWSYAVGAGDAAIGQQIALVFRRRFSTTASRPLRCRNRAPPMAWLALRCWRRPASASGSAE